MRILFLIFLLIISYVSVQGQELMNENCKSIYVDIIDFKLDEAQLKIDIEKQTHPENPYIFFFQNYIDFLIAFITEDEEVLEVFLDKKQERISQIEKLSSETPQRKYILGNMYLQFGLTRLKFHEYLTAALEINKAYHLLDDNDKRFPDFTPNKISLGVLHIMLGLVPDQYQWGLKLIDLHGSVSEGTAELYNVLDQSKGEEWAYLHKEALFYLGMIETNLNPNKDKTRRLLAELRMETDKGLLLNYLEISILMRSGKNDEALQLINNIELYERYYPINYLDYIHAECLLRRLDRDEALNYYLKFLSNFKGKNYVKDAWRKISWIAALSEDSATYYSYLRTASKSGVDDIDIDKEADREIKRGQMPNTDLLMARLLFDGGYYINAQLILEQMDVRGLTTDEATEQNYRFARVAHLRGQIDNAIFYYKKTIAEGKDSKRYYAANSALKLGEIFEVQNNMEEAIKYYEICLDLDFEEYKFSIRRKAKEGLNRLE